MADDHTVQGHAALVTLLKEALAIADAMQFTDVGLFLDRALLALGEQGELPDDLKSWADDLSSDEPLQLSPAPFNLPFVL